MKKFSQVLTLLVSLVSLTVAGCGKIPYRIDIDQGNFITQTDLDKLSVGMTKDAVQRAIGTPAIQDFFNQDRWDYVQRFRDGDSQALQAGRVSLFFTNGLLSQIDAEQFNEITPEPLDYSTRDRGQ